MSDPTAPVVTPADSIVAPVDRFRAISRAPRMAMAALRMVYAAAPRTLVFCFGLQVVSAVVVGLQVLVTKELVQGLLKLSASGHRSGTTILPELGGLVGATLISGVAGAILSNQQRLLGELVSRRTMDGIIDVASAVSLASFEDPRFYDQLERATVAATIRPMQIVNGVMQLLLALLTSVGIAVALLTIHPLLLPLIVLAGIPVLLATLTNSRHAYAFEYGMTTHARERLHLLELMTERESAKELRVFQATHWLRRRYDWLSDERIRRMREFLRGRMRLAVVGNIASAFAMAIAIGALAWLLGTNRLGVASAATAAVAMIVLASRLLMVTTSLGTLVESGLFLDDLQRFLDRTRELTRGRRRPAALDEVTPAELREVRVEDVTFTYPQTDRRVLHGVSMHVAPGEVVALVGENGSGKTTLVKLLCQLYDPDGGRIVWDGRDAAGLDPDALQAGMTVLFQDFVEYHLSAADNIALGRSTVPPDADRIEQAARRAGIHETIERLPAGYGTRLGRQFYGGHELSGGQWQRLALARAFYRGGDFLIMDEPTAALDPRAEYRLFEDLRELAVGKSVLLISHRFANVRMADRIYVMEEGRVVEHGTHDELMELDGLYAGLFRLQAAAYLAS